MAPNVELLQRVMALVEAADAEQMWNQNYWVIDDSYLFSTHRSLDFEGQHWCNTSACFAGWTVLLDGWTAETGEFQRVMLTKGDELIYAHESEELAATLLGLDYPQAKVLFNYSNSLQDLRDQVADLCAVEVPA